MPSLSARSEGFTLIELLIIVAILGILSTYVLGSMHDARNNAYYSTALQEMKQVQGGLEIYLIDNNGAYPPDVNRDIPPGIEEHLSSGDWPSAPWPGSVYDWDNWGPDDLDHNPQEQVVQLSIRFCEIGAPATCRFPDEEWAEDFDIDSSVYWCFHGPCRPHGSHAVDYPGYCMNCNE